MTRRRFPLVDIVVAAGSSGPRLGDPVRFPHGIRLEAFLDAAASTPAEIVDVDGNPIGYVTIEGATIPEFDGPDDGTATLFLRAVDDDGETFPCRALPDPAADSGADALVEAHNADTTDVHGISDTSELILEGDPRLDDARPPLAHDHPISDVVGLEAVLDDKVDDTDPRLSDARTPVIHTHTSGSVTDFAEAVQDVVAATLVGSGVTVTYDDAANAVTLAAAGSTDLEAVRDAIGVALVGIGVVSVTVDDAANTITISSTATANATDAALRDRGTHTGTQPAASVTGLAAVATTGAYGDLTGKPTIPSTAADVGATPAAHATDTNNPHNVTKAQVGLGSVVNSAPKTLLLASSTPAISPGVVNTVAETTLFSLTIPAAGVAVGDLLVLEYVLDAKNNSGASADIAYRFKIGATTVFTWTPSLGTNANRYKQNGRLTIALASLTDLRVGLTHNSTTSSLAVAAAFNAAQSAVGSTQVTTEDLSTDKVLTITAQPTVAAATVDARPYAATLTRTRT